MVVDSLENTSPPNGVNIEDLRRLMDRPNGTTIILELVRDGRASATDAARVIDASRGGIVSRIKAALMWR